MTSIISKYFDFNSKSVVKLNKLQNIEVYLLNERIDNKEYEFEDKDCICGSNFSQIIASRDKFGLKVNTIICSNCGLIRANPRFTEDSYSKFYKNQYRKLYTGKESEEHIDKIFQSQYKTGKEYYNFIKNSEVNINTVLDVGCSCGGVIKYFQDMGSSVEGVDYDTRYVEFGKRKGLKLLNGNSNILKEDKKYDLIILSHVVEHFNDPVKELTKLVKHLNKDGHIFIHVPGIKYCPYYKRYPFSFLFYIQNAHVYYFTLNTLINITRKASLECINGNEKVLAIFKFNSGLIKQEIINEFSDITQFLKNIENKRYSRLFYYYLNEVFYNTPKRILKFIIK